MIIMQTEPQKEVTIVYQTILLPAELLTVTEV